jgi:hypothetical protein
MWFMKPSNGSSHAGIIRFKGCKCDDKSWILKRRRIESWTSSVANFADCARVTTVSSAGGWLSIAPHSSQHFVSVCVETLLTYYATISFYNWSLTCWRAWNKHTVNNNRQIQITICRSNSNVPLLSITCTIPVLVCVIECSRLPHAQNKTNKQWMGHGYLLLSS